MARDFNGSSQYLTVSSAPVTAAPLTLAAWLYADGANNSVAVCLGQQSTTSSWELVPWSDGNLLVQNYDGTYKYGYKAYPTGAWFHACGVFDTSSPYQVAYVNGSSGTNGTSSPSMSTPSLFRVGFGDGPVGQARYFDGKIAEVGVWNVALTAAEVAALANGYSPLLIRPTALVGYWPLIGRYSPEIDKRGGRDLTLINSPAVADHCRVIYKGRPRTWFTGAAGGTSYTLTADAGSYAVTGSNAGLAYGHKVGATAGSYALTGSDATLRRSYLNLGANAGSYAVTGSDATLRYGHVVPAVAGSYAVTGSDATLRRSYVSLSAAAGSYNVTGSTASLICLRRLPATAGSYNITGSDAGLNYSGESSTYTLNADAGSYAVTGSDAVLRFAHKLISAAGSYNVTGSDATLRRTHVFPADAGSYNVTGSTAGLRVGHIVISAGGSYLVTGSSAGYTLARRIVAAAGSYLLTGADAVLTYSGSDVVLGPFYLDEIYIFDSNVESVYYNNNFEEFVIR